MATRRTTRIARYVEAARELRALRKQAIENPARLKHPRFAAWLEEARREHDQALRDLTGGDYGKACRQLMAAPTTTEEAGPSAPASETTQEARRRRRRERRARRRAATTTETTQTEG